MIASLTFTSCEDFLTEEVRGQQNLDTYFQSAEEAEAFITGCYQAITFGGWWNINTVWLLSEMCSDDGWMGNTSQSQSDYISLAHYQGTGQSNGAISNFWQYRYKGILRCNIAVERISQADFSDEEMKNRLVAEARFLRGYFYFELVKNFGGVPLITGFLLPEEIQGITRASAEDVYKFIEDDLKAAADVLPQRSQYAATDMGRATRGAALGLLGKVYLYQSKWQEAHDVLKTVIDEGEYKLLDNFGDVWDVDHNNSEESLFEVQYMYDGTYALGGSLTVITGARSGPGDGWSWGQPTANLEQAYIDAGDTERLRWTIIKTGCTEIAGENNFDKFVENNTKIANYKDYIEKYGWDPECYIIDPSQHKSARIVRKYFVSEEDLKEPTIVSMKKRLPWLIILLFLGMAVSSVVGIFESVVAVLPIVICFQSLVLDMAGNVGTQSLAVTIRVLVDEDLDTRKKLALLGKEMKIGFLNGASLGVMALVFLGIYIHLFKKYAWMSAFLISGCVGISLVVAMVISGFVGTIIPMFFHKIHIDPAVASGPLITTVNDLVAVITYYGLAMVFLIDIFHI